MTTTLPERTYRRLAGPTLTGAELVCESLVAHGVEVMFGYPGGAALPLYHHLVRYPIRHVLVRHEQNAAHAADGYARITGRPGVCLATSGPGATNLVTGIATAYMDCVPMVAITGQVPSAMIGKQAFQEVDVAGIVKPITKAAWCVMNAEELPDVLAEAFRLASEGRPGPVLVDIPKDVLAGSLTYDRELPVAATPEPPAPSAELLETIDQVAELLASAERPLLIAGHGVILANAYRQLWSVVERSGVPFATTLLGLSSMPEWHPQSLGLVGMHGRVAANLAMHHADVIVGVGMRFDDRVIGRAADYAPGAKLVHVDVDPIAFGRNLRCDVPVLADARQFLTLLADRVRPNPRPEWRARLGTWRDQHARCGRDDDNSVPTSPKVMEAIRSVTDGEATIVADVGQHQMYAALWYGYDRPNSYLTTGGLGTMGYALGGAMGAKLALGDRPVWAVIGDGGFQMSAAELNTLAVEGIDLKVAIINNGYLGMVRQWQEKFYEGNLAHSKLWQPDFAKLAEAHGCLGIRVTRASEVETALRRAMATPGPVVLDFRVPPMETVYPMVPPGACVGETICEDAV
ncbi:MAG: biosynthetic-type acetolactate synthase large subunit [Chloroflexi bacterium]|nr:biosynthetic-type acetolactate synthase large subunit [Chloroflexota bacterium]